MLYNVTLFIKHMTTMTTMTNGRGCNCPHIQTIESPFHRLRSPHSLKEEVGVLFSLDQANTSTIVQTQQLRTSQFEAKKTELD